MIIPAAAAGQNIPVASGSIPDQIISALGSDLVVLHDLTDWSAMRQDTAGSTAVTAVDDVVKYWADLTGNGNVATAESNSSPGYAISKVGHTAINNAGFLYNAQNLSTREAGMEMHVYLRPNSDTKWMLLGKLAASSHGAGIVESGNATATLAGFAGTVTDEVDGVTVSPATRDGLFDDVDAAGGWCHQAARGIDLTGEVGLQPLAYSTSAIRFDGDVMYIVITKSLSGPKLTALNNIFASI